MYFLSEPFNIPIYLLKFQVFCNKQRDRIDFINIRNARPTSVRDECTVDGKTTAAPHAVAGGISSIMKMDTV